MHVAMLTAVPPTPPRACARDLGTSAGPGENVPCRCVFRTFCFLVVGIEPVSSQMNGGQRDKKKKKKKKMTRLKKTARCLSGKSILKNAIFIAGNTSETNAGHPRARLILHLLVRSVGNLIPAILGTSATIINFHNVLP